MRAHRESGLDILKQLYQQLLLGEELRRQVQEICAPRCLGQSVDKSGASGYGLSRNNRVHPMGEVYVFCCLDEFIRCREPSARQGNPCQNLFGHGTAGREIDDHLIGRNHAVFLQGLLKLFLSSTPSRG